MDQKWMRLVSCFRGDGLSMSDKPPKIQNVRSNLIKEYIFLLNNHRMQNGLSGSVKKLKVVDVYA